jgi:hypothetical protein
MIFDPFIKHFLKKIAWYNKHGFSSIDFCSGLLAIDNSSVLLRAKIQQKHNF